MEDPAFPANPSSDSPQDELTAAPKNGTLRHESPIRDRACVIQGARTHNLKSISCRIPFGRLTAITGVSGSGKSTLAFDVVYAEGQRRFVDCLSTYARQFLQRLDRPEADSIGEIQPPVALHQHTAIRSARSTVGSITELSDLLQLLFAHGGTPHCPDCRIPMHEETLESAIQELQGLPEGRYVLAVPLNADTAISPFSKKHSRSKQKGARTIRNSSARAPAGSARTSVADRNAALALRIRALQEQGYTRFYQDGGVREASRDAWEPPVTAGMERRADGENLDAGVVAGSLRAARTERRAGGENRALDLGEEPLLVLDRFEPASLRSTRAREAIEAAWKIDPERAAIYRIGELTPVRTLRRGVSCARCQRRWEPMRPRHFSADSPLGACPACHGFGRLVVVDREKVAPDPRRTLREGAIAPFNTKTGSLFRRRMLDQAKLDGVPLDVPYGKLPAEQQDWVFAGNGRYRGVEGLFQKLERKRYRTHVRIFLARYRGYVPCADCRSTRLRPEALAMKVGGRDIGHVQTMPVRDLLLELDRLELTPEKQRRVAAVLPELRERLGYLVDVGLGYLTLARTARTLSGGETQRIRLASGLGTSLTGTLYILDEPTVGLHQTDTARMLSILHRLRDAGNSVVVVEHDPGIIQGADHLIVLGPSGGEDGGEILFEGNTERFFRENPSFFRVLPDSADGAETANGKPASKRAWDPPPPTRADVERVRTTRSRSARSRKVSTSSPPARHSHDSRSMGAIDHDSASTEVMVRDSVNTGAIVMEGIRHHNLDIERLVVPADRLVVVTGVSGSGKSTLIDDVLYRNAQRLSGIAVEEVGTVRVLKGLERFSEVLLVSQNPLGRSSRSNILTYTGLLAIVRKLLAQTPRAKSLRLAPGAFSFNVPGGRCEDCKGMGVVTIEMHFMADVEVACEACRGRRFREPVLEVAYRGKSILQMLDLTVAEACDFFAERADVQRLLAPLPRIGLGYLRLGQSTSTLSGGEAQRLKIASLLADKTAWTKPGLFLLDEPTTGLHPRDIERLLNALRDLIGRGHGVIVVEHQLDFIRAADHVIDLGPGGGDEGGRLLYSGPVAGLSAVESPTARALRTAVASPASAPLSAHSPIV